MLCLCIGLSGVAGAPTLLLLLRTEPNSDTLWRRMAAVVGGGSDETVFLVTIRGGTEGGVSVAIVTFEPPVILRANLRKGEIELEAALPELDTLDIRGPLGGVARYPFLVDAVPEVVDS